ncbi:MAG: uridine phosphorylase [Bacillota bacterium]|nr:nucleoside phosphorylase [Bacillota bacterium]MDK2930191.1 uridine phosphorylase [Bacillota bacterium]
MPVLDKTTKTQGRMQYHIRCKPGDVGKYVLLPGDPARVERIAQHLENPVRVAYHREFLTYTGSYKGITVSATSTGIGCPSAAIAVEELANIGAEAFIRVGSTGGLQEFLQIGDLVISEGAMKCEGTSVFHVPDTFPAVPDLGLTYCLIKAADMLKAGRGFRYYTGITASSSSFYGETQEFIRKLNALKVLSIEMEASAIFTVARQRGLKGAMISAVSGNMITGDVIYEGENPGLVKGWEDEIAVALEAIYLHEQGGFLR